MKTVEIKDEKLQVLDCPAMDDSPITMLNLLKYRQVADHSGYQNETPCSGREAYLRYTKHSFPLVKSIGGKVIFMGTALATIIGPDTEQWDDMLIVRYPSRKAFFGMLSSEAYRAVMFHRTAALEDSRLVAVIEGKASFQS
ncbi:MAG: DUF1330 domain-containing protein [Desulfobacterales bacterium]|jgi:uncharacterized protein (DUF1330 family)|nr:DUF1330 domain-containing protein [Desulfobacterales bacterium]